VNSFPGHKIVFNLCFAALVPVSPRNAEMSIRAARPELNQISWRVRDEMFDAVGLIGRIRPVELKVLNSDKLTIDSGNVTKAIKVNWSYLVLS
jgi:hypothetical protein